MTIRFLAFLRDWLLLNRERRKSFMPFLPRAMPPSLKVLMEFRMVNKPHATSWRDIHDIGRGSTYQPAKDDDDEMDVKDEDLTIICQLGDSGIQQVNVERDFVRRAKHTVYFTLDFNWKAGDMDVKLNLIQSESAMTIVFRTHFLPCVASLLLPTPSAKASPSEEALPSSAATASSSSPSSPSAVGASPPSTATAAASASPAPTASQNRLPAIGESRDYTISKYIQEDPASETHPSSPEEYGQPRAKALAFIRDWLPWNRGRRMSLVPFLPRTMPSSRKVMMEFRMVNKPHGTSWRKVHDIRKGATYQPAKDDDEMDVKDEDLTITCQLEDNEIQQVNVERDFVRRQDHTVYFTLDFNGKADDSLVKLNLIQSESKEIQFRTHFLPFVVASSLSSASATASSSAATLSLSSSTTSSSSLSSSSSSSPSAVGASPASTATAAASVSPAAASPATTASQNWVADHNLNRLSEQIPRNKYYEFCGTIGFAYNEANSTLAVKNNNHCEAVRQCLADWKDRTGGSLQELKEILEAAELQALTKYIEPENYKLSAIGESRDYTISEFIREDPASDTHPTSPEEYGQPPANVDQSEGIYDERGGELMIPLHGLTLAIPPRALEEGTSQKITVQVLQDSPNGINLRDDEMIVTNAFQCLPSGLHFAAKKSVRLTMPHCANLVDPKKVQAVLYFWNHETEEGQPERILLTPRTCRVTPHYVDIFLQHFSRGFLAFIIDYIWGKQMSFMPFLPRTMEPSRNVVLEFRMVNKPHGTSNWRDIHDIKKDATYQPAKDHDDEMNVKDEDLSVTCQMNNNEIREKNVKRDFVRKTNHTVYFTLDFNGKADDSLVQLMLIQSEQMEIEFITHFLPCIVSPPPPSAALLSSPAEASSLSSTAAGSSSSWKTASSSSTGSLSSTGSSSSWKTASSSSLASSPTAAPPLAVAASPASPVATSSSPSPPPASQKWVDDHNLNRLSEQIPPDKYEVFCGMLGFEYNKADSILQSCRMAYRKAVRKCLADWKNRTGGSLQKLKEILEAAELQALTIYIEPEDFK